MKTIVIFYQERKQDTSEVVARLVPTLEQQGYEVCVIGIHEEGYPDTETSLEGCDMAIVLGGDGTILKAARVCAYASVPILGINFGRVGFLTELEPNEVATQLTHYLARDKTVWVDRRTMLHAVLEQDECSEEFLALNDIVIARSTWPRVVQIKVWIDDHHYSTTYSDGMILSTATGSTAYNMAVGGPLLHPQVQSSMLTPIAPHLAFERSLILHPEATVKLQIFIGSQDGVFSADGQINRTLKDGAIVTVHKSMYETNFLRRRPPTRFYQVITAKLTTESVQASEDYYVT